MTSRQGVIRVRTVTALLGAGLLAASLGATVAGAEQPVKPTGTEELCPATEALTKSEAAPKQEVSLLRSHLGCQVSNDPGPDDPGGS